MNNLKKIAGIIWIVTGPLAIYYLAKTAAGEISKKPVIDTKIQWGIFIGIFIPIAIGLMIFGYYALKGEYSHLPENSKEI
jgi:purine-cytosine permease-like protein